MIQTDAVIRMHVMERDLAVCPNYVDGRNGKRPSAKRCAGTRKTDNKPIITTSEATTMIAAGLARLSCVRRIAVGSSWGWLV